MSDQEKKENTVALTKEEAEYVMRLSSLALKSSPGYDNVGWVLDAVTYFKRKFADGFVSSS